MNLFEITAGDLAQQKGQSQGVKDLGARLKTDHTQLDQTVQQTASQLGVELPSEPTADQQSVLDQLNNASGAEFDRLWVTSELAGHVQAIQATQTEISQGSEQSVVQLAQTALPTLQAHYDALVQLAEKLGIPVPQTSASGTPEPGQHGTSRRLRVARHRVAGSGWPTPSRRLRGHHRDAGSQRELTSRHQTAGPTPGGPRRSVHRAGPLPYAGVRVSRRRRGRSRTPPPGRAGSRRGTRCASRC